MAHAKIIVLCCLFLDSVFLCEGFDENVEPLCFSRFDYDYKMLSKVVAMETELRRLQETLNAEILSIRGNEKKLASVEAALALRQKSGFSDDRGSTFVRWGRTSCPENGTELLYEGYTGGSQHSHSGAAVDYLCLPTQPIWGHYDDSFQNLAFVYGAEYEVFVKHPSYIQQDVPCAVCHTKRATTLMIPGRNQCYDGWTMEYSGYLSAGHHGHPAASQYVCLDETPEVIPGGQSDHNGILFYSVEGACGSLKCPPYVNGRELTCVVCSK